MKRLATVVVGLFAALTLNACCCPGCGTWSWLDSESWALLLVDNSQPADGIQFVSVEKAASFHLAD